MTQEDQDLWDKARQQNDPYSEPTIPFPQAPTAPPTPPYTGTMYQGFNQGIEPSAMVSPGTNVQKKRTDTRKQLLVAAGVLVLLLLGIGGFVLLPALTAKANNQASTTTSVPVVSTPATTGKVASKNVYAPYLANYRQSIRSQMAQGLHLTVEQMNTQLEAGKTVGSIATAQGVSASQLQTLVTNVFQKAFQPAIDSQGLTQKQVDALIKRMIKQPQMLDRYLMVRAKKGVVGTPVAQ